eukprot:TRINITY_DN42466_c0_g1_i1.p1 TRINITY_DN42466_c0_g1~~TRINITY_DN42466_c0_g1_i1.p1  ORF type:complete len:488 (-),score=86.66 TRINITY_DN42466_c0_g1_i1:97-1560(-)
MATATARLQPRWKKLCRGLDVKEDDSDRWWELLETRHGEPIRAYHTLDHLDEMFGYFEEHLDKIRDPAAVSLAIFFHDVIYDPRSGSPKNEEDSAVLFDKFAQTALPPGQPPGMAKGSLIMKVRRWIVQTAHHKCSEEDESDCRYFMDFDMAVLGRPWADYEVYCKQIRHEYSHVSEVLFCAARSSFLESVAGSSPESSPIYATDLFRKSREQQARKNASQEAAVLRERFLNSSMPVRLSAQFALRLKALAGRQSTKLFGAGCLGGLLAAGAVAAPKIAATCVGIPIAAGSLGLAFGASYLTQPLPDKHIGGIAVTAGSYNPPHWGHLEVIRYLSKTHDQVHVVIGMNPTKKYAVSPYVRQELLRKMLAEIGLKNVEVVVWSSYVWKHAQEIGATAMYRGIRSWREDGIPEKWLELQNVVGQLVLGRGYRVIPTTYIQADPKYETGFSSTAVRRLISQGAAITDFMPSGCCSMVTEAYAEREKDKDS